MNQQALPDAKELQVTFPKGKRGRERKENNFLKILNGSYPPPLWNSVAIFAILFFTVFFLRPSFHIY